jgi:hypothetical protein
MSYGAQRERVRVEVRGTCGLCGKSVRTRPRPGTSGPLYPAKHVNRNSLVCPGQYREAKP